MTEQYTYTYSVEITVTDLQCVAHISAEHLDVGTVLGEINTVTLDERIGSLIMSTLRSEHAMTLQEEMRCAAQGE